jgi:hypothetical protein
LLHEQIVVSEEDQQPPHAFNDHVVDYMEGYFSSYFHPMLNYQLENEDESDQEIVIKGHCPSPEINIDILKDFQQDKVFQNCLSSSMNDVVVQFINGLDMDEDSENAFMEISSSEQTTGIEFQESNNYATFQSEIEKVNKEVVVLFNPFKNYGFENSYTRTPDCEIVHVVSFSHLQGYYELELIPIHSFERKNDSPQENFH